MLRPALPLLLLLLLTACLEKEDIQLAEPTLDVELVRLSVAEFEFFNRASGFADLRLTLDNGYFDLTPEQQLVVTDIVFGRPAGEVLARANALVLVDRGLPVGERVCYTLAFRTVRGTRTEASEFCFDVP